METRPEVIWSTVEPRPHRRLRILLAKIGQNHLAATGLDVQGNRPANRCSWRSGTVIEGPLEPDEK